MKNHRTLVTPPAPGTPAALHRAAVAGAASLGGGTGIGTSPGAVAPDDAVEVAIPRRQ
jgi:hypothetical protein